MASRKNFLYLGGGDQRITPVTDDPAFEFDESDLWNSNDAAGVSQPDLPAATTTKKSILPSPKWGSRKSFKNKEQSKSMTSSSLPVNVPDWSKILRDGKKGNDQNQMEGNFEKEDDDDDDDKLPPHEYLARRRGASSSVHEGIGRTLKGRDLSRVRNAIWKKTGFED